MAVSGEGGKPDRSDKINTQAQFIYFPESKAHLGSLISSAMFANGHPLKRPGDILLLAVAGAAFLIVFDSVEENQRGRIRT